MSGDDPSSEYVERMSPEQLCDWLKPHLVEEDWNDASRVITDQRIKGSNFLAYTWDSWRRYELPGGTADSLVELAKEIKEGGNPNDQLDHDIAALVGAEPDTLKMMQALVRDVKGGFEIPGTVFLRELKYRRDLKKKPCDDILEEMKCPNLESDELEMISKVLMNVYEHLLVGDKFCLESSFVKDKKRASEALIETTLGFLCLDFIMLRYTQCFLEDSHLLYNRNTQWTPPFFFRRGNGKHYKWTIRCDAELSFRVDQEEEYLVCLLVFAENSRIRDKKDVEKIINLLRASGETLKLLVGDKFNEPFFISCLSFQGCTLFLHVMEFTKESATYHGVVKKFDCTTKENCHEAMKCCWRIAKYASKLAQSICDLNLDYKSSPNVGALMERREMGSRSMKSNQPSSSNHSASKTGGSKRQRGGGDTAGAALVARLEEVIALLSDTGDFFDVEPMFETGVVYSSHIEINPRVDRILTATFGKNREAVVVKKVSPSEFGYVKKLKEKVHSLTKSPQSIGFCFPLNFKDFGGSMKFLVFKKIRPLSSLYFDDLGLVEKIYNQLFKFLRFCQAHQLVHGDLKLSNLGLDKDNFLCVFDWEERVDGTEGYMAPEVYSKSTKPNVLSDIYSAGILLKEIVDKASRFKGMDQGRLQRLRLAISSMLAVEPEKRKLVDLESTKLTCSDTRSASEESGSSRSVVPEKRPRMQDFSYANGDGCNTISTYQQ